MRLRGKREIIVFALLLPLLFCGAVKADDIPTESVTGETSAEVSVQTVNAEEKSYLIHVEWGDMQFVYDYGYAAWDATDMTYGKSSTKGWKRSYVNGTNNRIKVTNQSNARIRVGLQFNPTSSALNWSGDADHVVGNFFDTNEHAVEASKILTGTNSANYTGKIDELILETAEEYQNGTETVAAGARTASAYFAFSGTPDQDLFSKTSVGNISVSINDVSE